VNNLCFLVPLLVLLTCSTVTVVQLVIVRVFGGYCFGDIYFVAAAKPCVLVILL